MAVDTLREGVEIVGAQGRAFTARDLIDPDGDNLGKVVQEDEWTVVAENIGTKSEHYAAGAGPKDERSNTDGWSDFDMKVTPDGGTTVNDATGRFRYEVYSDRNRNDLIAKSKTIESSALRAAVTAGLREKILAAAMHEHVAGDDAVLALAYEADNGEDGSEVDVDDSTQEFGLAFSEIPGKRL